MQDINISGKRCFSGLYDLIGGDMGITSYVGMDIAPVSGKVVACGFTGSNGDFANFDPNQV